MEELRKERDAYKKELQQIRANILEYVHKCNNALNQVTLSCEMALEDYSEDSVLTDYLETIKNGSGLAISLTNKLLENADINKL